MHAERADRQRRPRRAPLRWDRVRAGVRELHARGEGDGLVDLRERGRHALRCRRARGQEAQGGADLLEDANRDETVSMHVEIKRESYDLPWTAEAEIFYQNDPTPQKKTIHGGSAA